MSKAARVGTSEGIHHEEHRPTDAVCPSKSLASEKFISAVLRACRQAGGVSIQEVASRLGYSTDDILAIETGTVVPMIKDIYLLSSVYGIDPQELVSLCQSAQNATQLQDTDR